MVTHFSFVSSILLHVQLGSAHETLAIHLLQEVLPGLPIAPGRINVHGIGILGGGGEQGCRSPRTRGEGGTSRASLLSRLLRLTLTQACVKLGDEDRKGI